MRKNIIDLIKFSKDDNSSKDTKETKKSKSTKTSSGEKGSINIKAKDKKIRQTIFGDQNNQKMTKLLDDTITTPEIGDVVEGPVISIEKSRVYVDLAPYGTAIIYGKEYLSAKDVIKKMNVGDIISAKVVDLDNQDGYIELSLREARQALIWSEAEEAIKNKTILELPVIEANKGGLILEWQGISGFLPASQLKPEHYPRVQDGDKDKILEELRKLVGQKIAVCIITASSKEGKLIFSEKSPKQKDKERVIEKYNVGDVLEGVITGVVDFGIFVKVEENLEGLVHISEIDWSLVDDPRTMFKIGQKVDVKVIEIKDNKISLSIKALKENPWVEAGKKYGKDKTVRGVIIKFNKHGALASIEEGIAGLVHISEFGSEEKLKQKLELGKTYDFKITLFDPKEQKMALSFIDKEKK